MYELLAVILKGAEAAPFDKVSLPEGEEVPMPTFPELLIVKASVKLIVELSVLLPATLNWWVPSL